ncbi:hypothetical protein DL240_12305 [Lujinxingia litoralis]|uniref:GYF domain-containing protein n=1 Tax=Lujinxingia litoralis TaxID=2211119 RepID=A0A328C682_9DELT|nr:GYF domain-containing protein [Lujinxingia litoralis]RAL21633.1 hypothetical protein DL240_12305 [Lujinxingia litoralis]
MKFYCDSCQTKYSIADEKVRGKVLKVRCKKCSHIITVREASRPEAAPRSVSRKIAWHYAINGQSFGPMDEEALRQKVASGEVGDAAYLWNETFGDWKPLASVAEFAPALRQAQAARPSPRTIGVKEALSAISVGEGLDSEPSFAEASEASEASETDDEATVFDLNRSELLKGAADRSPAPLASTEEAVAGFKAALGQGAEESRQDRLSKLRERLHLDGEGEADAVAPGPQPEERGVDLALGDTLDAAERSEQAAPGFGASEAVVDASETGNGASGPAARASTHDGLFSGVDAPGASSGVPAASMASAGPTEQEGGEDSVPFFPSAPRLGDPAQASSSRMEEITGSLLIQLNTLKQDSRKRLVMFGAGAAVLLVLVAAVGYVVATSESTEVVDDTPKMRLDNVGQRPEFRTYSKERAKRATNLFVVEDDIVISREEGKAAFEHEEAARKAGKSTDEIRREQVALAEKNPSLLPKIDTDSLRFEGGSAEGAQIGRGDSKSGVNREGVGATAGGFEVGGLAGAGTAGPAGADDRFQRMAALKTDSNREIYRPHADLESGRRSKGPEGLTPEEIAQGFRTVMQSIGLCRERHMWRGGTIEARRIHLTLQVLDTGRIGRIKLEPDSLEGTEFSRCMNTHRDRWSFPSFNGEPIEVRAPFVLQ